MELGWGNADAHESRYCCGLHSGGGVFGALASYKVEIS